MKRFPLLIGALLLTACTADYMLSAPSQMVVEGWIDDGGYPVVMVTKTVPTSTQKQPVSSLEDHILRWATVTVSDGEESVVLTGRVDERYFPPYVFTTGRLRGEAGKTYTLDVEAGEYHARAVTTIPEPQPLEELKTMQVSDTLYNVYGCYTPVAGSYYKYFMQVEGKDSTWVNVSFSLVNGNEAEGRVELPVTRGWTLGTALLDYQPLYTPGETVRVKFCRMDEAAYCFWQSYEEVSTLSLNPMFPSNININSNVEGAYGAWIGYAPTYYEITVGE